MFTGIIETAASLIKAEPEGSNVHFTFSCALTPELKIDQSVAHNGVCLTVVGIKDDTYKVTAIQETLLRSNLGDLNLGDKVNIERCMPANGRFDGHIVQGHVDTTAKCSAITDLQGSWEFEFEHAVAPDYTTVQKGSITINGVSLTVVKSENNRFSVHIIPYTLDHTNFKTLQVGSRVNLEFDIIGKYVAKMLAANN
jgi:riboflavin synthase